MILAQGTDLVRKDSIQELCGHRNRALQLYKQAVETLHAAQQAHSRACGNSKYPSTEFLRDMRYTEHDITPSARRSIDKDMWRFFIVGTPLGSLMDTQERKEFETQVEKDPPEITPETVFATMSRLAGDAEQIFRRGLVNAFRVFCRDDYKSHDGFKIGKRFLISDLVRGSSEVAVGEPLSPGSGARYRSVHACARWPTDP